MGFSFKFHLYSSWSLFKHISKWQQHLISMSFWKSFLIYYYYDWLSLWPAEMYLWNNGFLAQAIIPSIKEAIIRQTIHYFQPSIITDANLFGFSYISGWDMLVANRFETSAQIMKQCLLRKRISFSFYLKWFISFTRLKTLASI